MAVAIAMALAIVVAVENVVGVGGRVADERLLRSLSSSVSMVMSSGKVFAYKTKEPTPKT